VNRTRAEDFEKTKSIVIRNAPFGLLRHLAPGDVVTVTRIDRLARSTFDLFAIVKQIVDAKAQFRSLAEPWADTGTSTGRLMIAVLGGLADVERDLIRTRTAEGRSRAKARGQQMGRPPALTPTQQKEATRRRAQGATLDELARSYNVGISTIRRATRPAAPPLRRLFGRDNLAGVARCPRRNSRGWSWCARR
jgi:DNA invertase Pin-like site-specific DNA recombinase